jgi:preprotein translocase SecE subunit
MLRFFRESIKEFDHVVWPTKAETVRYFGIVISVIAVLTVFLFILGTTFSASLFTLRSSIVPTKLPESSSSSDSAGLPSDIDLSSLVGSGTDSANTAAPSASGEPVPVQK